jgi:hypothetical protein
LTLQNEIFDKKRKYNDKNFTTWQDFSASPISGTVWLEPMVAPTAVMYGQEAGKEGK